MSDVSPTIYVGNFIHSLDHKTLEIVHNGVIGVTGTGVIVMIEKNMTPEEAMSKNAPRLLELERQRMPSVSPESDIKVVRIKKNQFLLPGFFDTHVHASQYPNVGIFGDSTLLDWLDKYTFPLESKFVDPNLAKQVYTYMVGRSLSNGTTFASYYGTVHIPATIELAKLCDKVGQRAHVGRVCMERHCPDALVDKNPLHKDKVFVKEVRGLKSELVDAVITPRFAASCTAETLEGQGKLAKEEKVHIQTHLNENKKEIEWMKELFPGSKHYTDIYDKAGLVTEDSIYAHCIHMTFEELKLFKERKTGISHCPLSNIALGSGVAPIRHYLEDGLKVSLGTDVSGGYSPSVLANARQAILMSRELARATGDDSHKLDIANAIYLSTLGGAKCMNREKDLGNFTIGKKFDAQLIDISTENTPVDIFEWNTPQDPEKRIEYLATKWMYLGDDRNTKKVWVNGQLVLDKTVQ